MHVPLPPEAEHFLVQLAVGPAADWLRAARAYAQALQDARVALAAAALQRAIELADERDAAVAREVERRVERVAAAVARDVSTEGGEAGEALAAMRRAAVSAVSAVALRAQLKPLEVALLVAPFRGTVLPEFA